MLKVQNLKRFEQGKEVVEMIEQAAEEWAQSVSVNQDEFDVQENTSILKRLEKPKDRIDAVIDTDTYNEIDDQYALAYLINSGEKIDLKAIYAAPFKTYRCSGPGDGMEKSYREIFNVLKLMEREDLDGIVHCGSTTYLENETAPVISDAARDLAQRAMAYSPENPLYVVGIATITNVASALLLNPEIRNRIVIVWLGGNALNWPTNNEFNMTQDIAAARIVFGSKVPLVQLPCMGVVSAFSTSGPELEAHLKGKNRLCDYLLDTTFNEATACGGGAVWSRPIWDVTAVGWLLDGDFIYDRIAHAPIPEYSDRYSFSDNRHFYKYVYHIQRDNLFADLFRKLSKTK
jgi:inosine-uridine nucleoside N-ribohydrolase